MKAFIEPLQELSGYEDMTKAAMQPGLVTISGCTVSYTHLTLPTT